MKAVLLLFLLPLQVFAQDISGVWTGFLETGDSRVAYELVISANKEKFTGYSLTAFTINGVENIGVKSIKLKKKQGDISIEDNELLYNNYTTPPKRVKLYASLYLQVVRDTGMILSGTFTTRSFDFREKNPNPFSGTISLRKKNNFTQTKLMSKLDELNLSTALSFMQPVVKEKQNETVSTGKSRDTAVLITRATGKKATVTSPSKEKEKEVVKTTISTTVNAPAADLSKRKTEIIQNVFIKSDSLVISLYDNGEIDGDTVSVVVNGKIILAKQGLTAKAITTTIYMPSNTNDSLQLVMYAENLGRIPPNTGLLVLQDGNNRYDIRFAGDLQKSSAIILKRKP
jgi:hypothetical protein